MSSDGPSPGGGGPLGVVRLCRGRLESGSGVGGRGLVAASGLERLDAHVALGDGPLVGLLGQEGADEADDGGSVGEDADDVGAAPDLLVESSWGLLERILGQCSKGKALKAKMSSAASSRYTATSLNPASVSLSTTSPRTDHVVSRSGCSKMERTKVAIIGHEALGTRTRGSP